MGPRQFQTDTGRPLLICAHPGHELLLFHWMELFRPRVFLLTDGSGGVNPPRTKYSENCLQGVGAELITTCGVIPDRSWYEAILRCDARPFMAMVEEAETTARRQGSALVVSDAVDGYNPMHDLCEAIGMAVSIRLGRGAVPVEHLVNAVTPGSGAPVYAEFPLDPAALWRKRAAVDAYIPLADEARRLAHAEPSYLAVECLRKPVFNWPEIWSPSWEKIGRERVVAQVYDDLIEYERHVRPIVKTLLAAAAA